MREMCSCGHGQLNGRTWGNLKMIHLILFLFHVSTMLLAVNSDQQASIFKSNLVQSNVVSSNEDFTIDDEDQSRSRTSNLTCYTCTTFDNYTCRSFNHSSVEESSWISKRDCPIDEPFCSVTRVEYMTNERILRKFWALERGCSATCIPGCILLGEGERTKLHLCNSCCTSSLCNVNDLANGRAQANLWLVSMMMMLASSLRAIVWSSNSR